MREKQVPCCARDDIRIVRRITTPERPEFGAVIAEDATSRVADDRIRGEVRKPRHELATPARLRYELETPNEPL